MTLDLCERWRAEQERCRRVHAAQRLSRDPGPSRVAAAVAAAPTLAALPCRVVTRGEGTRIEDPSHQDRAGRGHTSLNPISSQSLTGYLFIIYKGWEKDTDRVPRHLREQDLGRTIRDTGERSGERTSASRHGGGLGRVHPHDRVPGIPLSYRTKLHPAARGQARQRGPPTGCALLVLLLLCTDKRDSDRFAARWTPYSTGDLSRLATFLRLLTGSLSLSRAH